MGQLFSLMLELTAYAPQLAFDLGGKQWRHHPCLPVHQWWIKQQTGTCWGMLHPREQRSHEKKKKKVVTGDKWRVSKRQIKHLMEVLQAQPGPKNNPFLRAIYKSAVKESWRASAQLGWGEAVGRCHGWVQEHPRVCVVCVCEHVWTRSADSSGNCSGRSMCTKDTEAY